MGLRQPRKVPTVPLQHPSREAALTAAGVQKLPLDLRLPDCFEAKAPRNGEKRPELTAIGITRKRRQPVKGTITACLMELVEKKFGKDKWAEILENAKLTAHAEDFRMAPLDIPDEEFDTLVSST